MASHKSPSGSLKRTSRNISHPLPRRQTKGPLDVDQGPPAETSTPSTPENPLQPQHPTSSTPTSPRPQNQPNLSSPSANPSQPLVSLSFLQTPKIYHPLPLNPSTTPLPFHQPLNKPSPSTPIETLLKTGHYRQAATTTVHDLLALPPTATTPILQNLHTRLSCLLLLQRPDLALQEAAPLSEALATPTQESRNLRETVPWALRLLLLRCQSLGLDESGRRAVMGYFALGSECRERAAAARNSNDAETASLWDHRLRELGLRVVDTFVEMGELETAGRYLQGLGHDNDDDDDSAGIAYRRALLKLRVGDIASARSLVATCNGLDAEIMITLLNALATDPAASVPDWRALTSKHPDHEALVSNLAVCQLYAGEVGEARSLLEGLLEGGGPVFGGLLFNLATVFELCTDRATEAKMGVAAVLAEREGSGECGGWERGAAELKL
ncbi:hypothetical protein MBLNU230_g2027t1 [Neophaeotheca triangularis]